jgi:hypothetical protein
MNKSFVHQVGDQPRLLCRRFAQVNTILGERVKQDSENILSSEHTTR